MRSRPIKERFQAEPAEAIVQAIKAFVNTSPLNRMPSTRELPVFDEPLIRFADGDDPLYTAYKTIIDAVHLTPREAMAQALGRHLDDLPAKLSVISWILPITRDTRRSNRLEKALPSRRWSHTRWYGELFNNALREHVTALLVEAGFLAVAPVLQAYFQTFRGERGPFSNWSERHTAYAAGHGSFSLSDGFITERGIAHRCGSVITDLPLPVSPRAIDNPYANCLFYVDGSCIACVVRCPAGAISKTGHDKLKCMEYLHQIGYLPMMTTYNDETSVAGCGLCQVKVPCEFRIPAKVETRRTRACQM